jgi:hypothetical protein
MLGPCSKTSGPFLLAKKCLIPMVLRENYYYYYYMNWIIKTLFLLSICNLFLFFNHIAFSQVISFTVMGILHSKSWISVMKVSSHIHV